MALSNIFSFTYWAVTRPGGFSPRAQSILILILALLIVASIIIKILSRRKENKPTLTKLLTKLFNLLIATAIAGVILLFFRYENMPFLAGRFWWLLLIIGDLVWLFFILKYRFKKMPGEQNDYQRRQEINKYLKK